MRLAGHRQAGEIERVVQFGHQRAQAAGIEEILHQELAGRPHIGEHRDLARDLVEALHVERQAGAARHRHHMDDGVGRAAHRHVHADGVVEGGRRQDLLRRQIVPHHVDDAAAGGRAHARMRGIGGRNRGRARQRQAERLGDRHHGGRRAHHHAGAEERAMPPSISAQSSSLMRPARFSSQYFQASEPEPSTWPCQLPRSCGPAGT